MPAIMWFRRDLRLGDNPALLTAINQARAEGDGRVLPVFVIDPHVWGPTSPLRRRYLVNSLTALNATLDGHLATLFGKPQDIIPRCVHESKAESVHIAADYGPYGATRDNHVQQALTVPLVRTGSPYAVAPGRINKADGSAYRVFTPFYRAWVSHGWRAPAEPIPTDVEWFTPLNSDNLHDHEDTSDIALPPAGEEAAWRRWEAFHASGLSSYPDNRDRPDLAGTSTIGHHLKFGEIHPRSILADLADSDDVFRREICWREFYADVLAQRPQSTHESLDTRFDTHMRWLRDSDAFDAWALGQTGFPFVDAGMRQLRTEGWMHNRVRMVVASFLVKDLHQPWQRGAREFMRWLRDGDVASNSHGWQWTAGCGTDAAPFFRIFNPISQGLKFDPSADYVRQYIPELRHLTGKTAHEPWKHPDGYLHGYPTPIVDHATERQTALADFSAIKRTH